jgi:hypothetical protein
MSKMALKPAGDLFPLAREPFSDALFSLPENEYRGMPMRSRNEKLNRDQLMRQMDDVEALWFGGSHMHTKVGLDTEYPGEEYMQMLRACVDCAEEKGMTEWLYNGDIWPSGFAGGKVTERNENYGLGTCLSRLASTAIQNTLTSKGKYTPDRPDIS